MDNKIIINKAAIDTSSLAAGGLLTAEQARTFLVQAMGSAPLLAACRHELRKARKGELDKLGVGRRLLRGKTEDQDDNYRAGANFGKVEYSTVAVRVPWEISEETLRENIEGEGLEAKITDLMTKQVGIDTEDLAINGDTTTSSSDPDYDFLKLNNGWLKLLASGSHVCDRTSISSGAMSINVYYSALRELPNKYHNPENLRWIMSPNRKAQWEEYLLNLAVTAGGIVTDNRIENPAAIKAMAVGNMPDDRIILTDPKNLVIVNTYDMRIRKTTEGKEAVMQDKRFYVIHLDVDSIVEELDAAVLIKGLAAIS